MSASPLIDILLIDSESTELPFISDALAGLNVNLVHAHTYDAARYNLLSTDFAVIIINLQLPIAHAIDFAQFIRTATPAPATPIIFLDHLPVTEFPLDDAYSLGAIDYILLPVSPVVLCSKVKIFIDLYNAAKVEEKIRASEERYKMLFNSIDEGFCTIEMLFDENGKPFDYRFLQANAVFEGQTGLHNVVGNTASKLVPNLEQHWFEQYGSVARTGIPLRFVLDAPSMNRWFDVYAFRIGGEGSHLVAILFKDISAQKTAELESEHLFRQVQAAHAQMTEVFQKAPAFMCTLKGPRHIFENVNENYFQLIGQRDVIGKTVGEGLPEIIEQGYVQILDEVYRSGNSFVAKDAHVMLQRKANEPQEERILDFVYLPLRDADDQVYGILVHGIDSTERQRAENGLRNLATELSQSNQHKTEFLAILAHELRNPLAPIRNGLEVLRLTGDDPVAFSKVRDMMQRQVDQMVHLIDDLLDIARISNGKLELKKERVALSKIIGHAIETSMPIINANQHALTVDTPEQAIFLNADQMRLSQVLGNLLTNAAKYTPVGGQITLSVQIQGAELVIAVSDNGIGIPAESLPIIFAMFTQVGLNMSRAQGGLGIGLSLVDRLVDMHGGKVSVQSEGVGKGSTFTVRLPAIICSETTQVTTIPVTPVPHRLRDKSLRILVADDNIDAAESLVKLFQLMGHETCIAHDGIQALQAAQRFVPDIAFLDIGMPGMSGNQVAVAVKKEPAIENIVLIALTGWGAENDRAESKAAGFDHHMTKPMDIEVVKRLLAEIE
ncbi:MAG: ATP-binding protein [Cellvibrio sp.]|uniref:hybrid sensor histidine kinase/response regulator n=1 Tax=Cellvibrio sp. TaxID=1965322 RepID=UPI0031A78FD2